MLCKSLIKSLSVKVTLKYVISGRVTKKLSKECQPMAPNLFFRLISYYCIFYESSKLTSETNLFVNGFSHFAGLFLNPNASSLLGSYLTTREWQFLPHSYGKKMSKFVQSPLQTISCQNRSKSFTTFLTQHTTRATHQREWPIWPRFVKILCFSYLCVKFQPSQCIFTLDFDLFPSSFNFERGVKRS